MLRRLTISNYALIERIELDLREGFTVITGETGAGKSIMLEALGLVLGSRANFNAIRSGEEKCFVEAAFQTTREDVVEILRENGLDILPELLLRRELTTAGRSRAFVNDTPVSASLLKELGRLLVDLHGQQENLALQTATYQCHQLDLFAGSTKLVDEYARAYHEWRAAMRELSQLKEAAAQVVKDQDYFRFQYEELSTVELGEEVYRGLEEELNQLEHADDIQRMLHHITNTLSDDQAGVLNMLHGAIHESETLKRISGVLGELHERLRSAAIELDDIAAEAQRHLNNVDINPAQLELVREKLDEYQRLMHKHSAADIATLVNIREDYRLRLESIESFDQEVERMEQKAREGGMLVNKLASRLSEERHKARKPFEDALLQGIRQLGMPKAAFKLDITTETDPGPTGTDRVQMLFNANGPQHLNPISEVASGGEISRLMLTLKSIQQKAAETTTMVFDEIDTGVSGEVAKRIGALMKELGTQTQVIAVTHLPGVAARGDHHLKITKDEHRQQTMSRVTYLSQEQRIEELAGMFSGDAITDASRESARILLDEP